MKPSTSYFEASYFTNKRFTSSETVNPTSKLPTIRQAATLLFTHSELTKDTIRL